MNRRDLIGTCAAAMLAATVAAQQQAMPQSPQAPTGGRERSQPTEPLAGSGARQQDRSAPDAPVTASQITLTGCVQRESDYRQGVHSGPGASGTAAPISSQFVLINASLEDPVGADPADRRVGTSGIASAQSQAYALGGTRGTDLSRHVGKRVEVKGAIAATDPTSSTTGGISPTRPLLQTVTVSSIREIAGACKM